MIFQLRHKNGKKRNRVIAYVVTNGDPVKVSDFAIKLFFDELHKEVSLDYAQKKIIYSEHFIRYHEKREKDVSKAIHKLFELYGYAQTKYDLKKNGIQVIILYDLTRF